MEFKIKLLTFESTIGRAYLVIGSLNKIVSLKGDFICLFWWFILKTTLYYFICMAGPIVKTGDSLNAFSRIFHYPPGQKNVKIGRF